MNSEAALERVSTLGVVGHDEDNWGVGVSGVVDNPSPFPRVNRLRDWFLDEYRSTVSGRCWRPRHISGMKTNRS